MKKPSPVTESSNGHPKSKGPVTRRQTPEERELASKVAELTALQGELAQRELELATLEAELRGFEVLYLRIVGSRYATLDDLEARIAEARAALSPQDETTREAARAARKQAEESAHRIQESQDFPAAAEFKPTDDLKRLYREIAKQVHPDLTLDDEERARRHRMMAEANLAFRAGDAERLEQILREWESSPESVKGEGTAAELVRVIRKIAQARERLRVIEVKISQLRESDLYQLKRRVEQAKAEGTDLLTQMATDLDLSLIHI